MSFGTAQKIILFIAIILLIIIFVVVIWTFVSAHSNTPWPPTSQTCPDYWPEGTPGTCMNTKGLGSCEKISIDFSNVSACDKYNWSIGSTVSGLTGCGEVQWDGINYGYGQYTPCDSGYNPYMPSF